MKSLTALCLLVLSSCGFSTVSGNGAITTSTRDLSAFRKISVGSAFNVHAVTGTRAVTIRADENLMPFIETVVDGDTLTIRVAPGTSILHATKLEAEIANDALEGIDASGAANVTLAATPVTAFDVKASGSSDVTVTGISSTSLTVLSSGGSNVTLTGTATSAKVDASGGSVVTMTGVPLTTMNVDASGASNVTARVSTTLTGTASGASNVTIAGTPDKKVESTGASTVTLGAP